MNPMTLVLSVLSRDSLWLVVDRRLSGGQRRDDAVKVMDLETTDGVGLLGYAGLGRTPGGTEPSAWMAAVLRGRGGLTFEQALGVLSAAANRELPKHLERLPGHGNSILVPAFIRGVGARIYSIDNLVDPTAGKHWYRYTSHQFTREPDSPTYRLALAGTGGDYLRQQGRAWRRSLLGLVKMHDRKKFSDLVIADRLAALNYQAYKGVPDKSVGPRCIVLWRRRPDARQVGSGGGHQFYTGVDRDRNSDPVPTIANGMDVNAIAGVLLNQFRPDDLFSGVPFNTDTDELNRLLARLPSEPDETLR